MSALLFLAGLVTLIVGAEALVRGASRLALLLGAPPLLIGLTVAAYGTSAPEMAVSLKAGLAGQADVAIGNVVGSNIFNVLVILGVSALIRTLAIDSQLVRRDVPIMIAASALALALASDGILSRSDGTLLTTGAIAYTLYIVMSARRSRVRASSTASPAVRGGVLLAVASVLCGLALLVLGARWLVIGSVAIARGLGVSELLVGVSVVAAGTSLPEVATSVVATVRGERDIAVGNVIGSNIFNLLAILGVTALLVPQGIAVAHEALRFDLPVALIVAAACLPIFFTGRRINRWEGLFLLAGYVAYVVLLVVRGSRAVDQWVATALEVVVVACAVIVGGGILLAGVRRARRTWRAEGRCDPAEKRG